MRRWLLSGAARAHKGRVTGLAIDGLEFRRTLGQFATGITIVTIDLGDAVHGMTANSFTSVSLDPPLILVCVDKKNETHALLERFGRFAVNVLAEDQEPVSNYYAGRPGGEPGRFHRPGTVAPVLEGCLSWLDCRLRWTCEGGDHSIFVAEVERLGRPGGRPLLYFGGRYTRLPAEDAGGPA